MLASLAEAPLDDPALVYEPKYDGIRAIAEVGARGASVTLWSRLGNDKTSQFSEVAAALKAWARRRRESVVLDGEIVALDEHGTPAGFQQLQGRIHVGSPKTRGRSRGTEDAPAGPVAFIVFDVLRVGTESLCERPLVDRRAVLERLLRNQTPTLRLSEQVRGDARALYGQALEQGWEGLIAKRADSRYRPGRRSPDWCKLKIIQEQEFVVGGWTEPRHTRSHFGALLLGVYDGDALVYVGHTGTGFDHRELARVMALMAPLESKTCPFATRPKSNERAHWLEPVLVAQVKFTEWTADNYLRHPVYLGLRDDKPAREVTREQKRLHASVTSRVSAAARGDAPPTRGRAVRTGPARTAHAERTGRRERTGRPAPAGHPAPEAARNDPALGAVVDQLQALEDARRNGTITLPDGSDLSVTNLHKVFWPALKLTKGDLFRYYARVSPAILPVLADRPLVMKRFPNGIDAKPFYQHRATDVPAGIRIEKVQHSDGPKPQLVGGDLLTLLYTCQLAAISQDPWFSRIQSPDVADQVALDLDPSDDVPFETVLDVARWIHDELDTLGVTAFPKTSGASGLHIYIPLAPGTSYEAGLLFCQLVATLVAEKHPEAATVERTVRARGARVYVDYLQNIQGKTLASAYSARASEYAGVSTPLTWKEVHDGVRREDFTIQTMPARLAAVGDLWAGTRGARGADLRSVVEKPRRRRR